MKSSLEMEEGHDYQYQWCVHVYVYGDQWCVLYVQQKKWTKAKPEQRSAVVENQKLHFH